MYEAKLRYFAESLLFYLSLLLPQKHCLQLSEKKRVRERREGGKRRRKEGEGRRRGEEGGGEGGKEGNL